MELGQCATPVPVAPKRATSSASQMDAVREPHVVAQPAEVLEVLHRAHAEALDAEDLLVERLGQVGVQPHAAAARELRGLGHQLGRDREGRARRQRDAHHRPRRRVVEAVDGRLAGGQDRVAVLDDLVGRQAAVGLPEVHRPAARVKAHARGRAPPRSRPRAGRRRRRGKT